MLLHRRPFVVCVSVCRCVSVCECVGGSFWFPLVVSVSLKLSPSVILLHTVADRSILIIGGPGWGELHTLHTRTHSYTQRDTDTARDTDTPSEGCEFQQMLSSIIIAIKETIQRCHLASQFLIICPSRRFEFEMSPIRFSELC